VKGKGDRGGGVEEDEGGGRDWGVGVARRGREKGGWGRVG